MAVSTIEVLVTADASPLTNALNQGAQATKQFEQVAGGAAEKATGAFSSIGQTLKTLAPAFVAVGAATVGAVTKGITATQQWASDTRALQKITGQTAEGASTLLSSANLLGIGVDKLSIGFGTLSKAIVNGAPNLERYGITVEDTSGAMLPFDDILGNVIDKFQTLPEGPQQAAFAMNVFGRSGRDLIPILARGRDGMAELAEKATELGLVMGQDDLDASKSLTAAQRELGLAFKGAAISLGKLFIPALTEVVKVASKAIEFFTRLPDPVKEIGVGLGVAAGAVGVLTIAMNGLKSTFGPVIGGLTSFGKALLETGLFQNASSALSGVSSAVELVGAEVQKSSQQIEDSAGSASDALTELHDVTTVAAVAAETQAVKSAQSVQTLGSRLTGFFKGIGSSIAAFATSAPVLIAVVTAAVVGLTIAIVKNWDTIKQWASDAIAALTTVAGPILDAIAKAWGEVTAAASEAWASFKDAGAAVMDALRQVGEELKPLLPLLATVGKALAGLAGATILIALWALADVLKVVAIGLKAFASIVEAIPGPVKTAALALGGLYAAANLVTGGIKGLTLLLADVFGKAGMVKTADAVLKGGATALTGWGKALAFVKTNFIGLAAVVGAGVFLFETLSGIWKSAHTDVDALSRQYGLSADLISQFNDQVSLSGHAFESHGSLSAFVAGIGDTSDNLNSLLEAAAPLNQELMNMGAGFTSTTNLLHANADAYDGSAGSIKNYTEWTQGGIDAVKGFTHQFVTGSITLDQYTALVANYGITASGAFSIAAHAIADYGAASKKSIKDVQGVIGTAGSLASTVTDAVADLASRGIAPLNATLADVPFVATKVASTLSEMGGAFDDLAATSGQDFGAIRDSLLKTLADPATKVEDLPGIFEAALTSTRQALQAWRADVASAFGGAGSALGRFADKSNVDLGKAIESLKSYTADIHEFGRNIDTIEERFGKKAHDFIQWASSQGLAQSGLVDAVASSNGKMAENFVKNFNVADDATESLARRIVNLFDNAADRIINAIKRMIEQLKILNGQTVEPKVKLDTSEFYTPLHGVQEHLRTLTSTDYKVRVGFHSYPDSPWPDEALKMHLTDPLDRTGFKRVGDRWTLPLDVTAHSVMNAVTVPLEPLVSPIDPIAPPDAKLGEHMNLGRLVQVTIDSRGILKDIRSVLRRMDAVGGRHHAGTSDVTGGIGHAGAGGTATSSSLDDALHRIVKLAEKSGMSAKESMDIVKRVSQQGADTTFIKKSVAMVADELGNSTAKLYGRALRRLDDATLHSDAKRAALIKAALEAQEALHHRRRPRLTQEERFDFPMHRIPQLPAGHTRIDPNRHELNVRLDRKHFDRQLSYDESYRGY